jgi:hypothetical protein
MLRILSTKKLAKIISQQLEADLEVFQAIKWGRGARQVKKTGIQ